VGKYIYGPVFSRRLGSSLGIDLVPLKTCNYECIYCQLGRTTNKTTERKEYAPVVEILRELGQTLSEGVKAEYISFAGFGERSFNR
jgi:wyosine [tRNA(Phe)-imidazoG37] synthetase (radical SAM superfamily)